MRKLFLDDNETRIEIQLKADPDTVIARTADECIAQLAAQEWDIVFLDHDLGGQVYQNPLEQNSGSEVVRWIVENEPKVRMFVIHTWNIPAGNHMAQDLIRAGYSTYRVPFMGGPTRLET